MIFFFQGIHIVIFNMNTLINLHNDIADLKFGRKHVKETFQKIPKYSRKDFDEIYEFMKFINKEEIEKYEEEYGNRKINFVKDDCLDEEVIVFEDIFTDIDDNGKISLYVFLEDGSREYLFNYNMNKYEDISIKYERQDVDVSFFNSEKGGNLKCLIYYSMYWYPSKGDIFSIKKKIESMLYDIEDYCKFYINFLADRNLAELKRDYELEEKIREDIRMAQETDEIEIELLGQQIENEEKSSKSEEEEEEDDGGLYDIQYGNRYTF